jgi:hypothetical protein
MDYSSARYMLGIFYGLRGLGDAPEVLGAVGRALAAIQDVMPHLLLDQKGLLYLKGLQVKSVRRSKFSPNRLVDCSSRTEGAQEAGFYIFDKNFDSECAPTVLCNVHISAGGTIAETPVHSGTDRVGVFVAVAVERVVPLDFERFVGGFRSLASELGCVRGAIWKDVSYVFEGSTAVEWAYRNITASLPGGEVSRWDPESDIVL